MMMLGLTQLNKFSNMALELKILQESANCSSQVIFNLTRKSKFLICTFTGIFVLLETGFISFIMWKGHHCWDSISSTS